MGATESDEGVAGSSPADVASAGALDEPRKGPGTAVVATLVVGVLVALLIAVLATRSPSTERVTRSPLIGHLAPTVEGVTLTGARFDLAELRGRWVVVNFFATWCIPCLEEHPELVAFQARHRAAGDASVVSILFDDDPDKARDVFEERGGDWPVVIDAEGAVGVAFGVARVPESFLVAPDGTVVQRLVGGVTAAQLDDILVQYEAAATAARS